MSALVTVQKGGTDLTDADVLEAQQVANLAHKHILAITGLPAIGWGISPFDGALEGQIPTTIPVEQHRAIVEAFAEVFDSEVRVWGSDDQYVETRGTYIGSPVKVWGFAKVVPEEAAS